MKKRVLRKLKSTRGASLILALLFFMMCAVFGAIILGAASTAAGAVSNSEVAGNGEYAILSMANSIRDEIINNHYLYNGSMVLRDEASISAVGHTNVSYEDNTYFWGPYSGKNVTPDRALADLLDAAVEEVWTYNNPHKHYEKDAKGVNTPDVKDAGQTQNFIDYNAYKVSKLTFTPTTDTGTALGNSSDITFYMFSKHVTAATSFDGVEHYPYDIMFVIKDNGSGVTKNLILRAATHINKDQVLVDMGGAQPEWGIRYSIQIEWTMAQIY